MLFRSDPSYEGQILVTTFPQLGNYGVPPAGGTETLEDHYEGSRIHCRAIIAQDYSFHQSHWLADRSLAQWLQEEKIPGIYGIDTRALTKHLRQFGSMLGKETMINQIEEQQNLMAEMIQELQERDRQLLSFQEQNQSLQILNSELSGLLNLLPDTEELLSQIEQQKNRIEQLETENQQWQELTQKLNNENSLLLKQSRELLTLNSR